jgi:lipopolysaccharide export system protein LptC
MARYDNLHSALVAWLKVLLPLIALAILSTLFLVARTIDPEGAIPFAEVDIDDRIREPRLTRPTWAGVTSDGTALTLRADEARPARGEDGASARAVTAELELAGGGEAGLVAAAVQLDPEGRQMTLSGGVVVTTSTGYRLETEGLTAMLDRTGMQSAGPVVGEGPGGTINAGELRLGADPDRPGTQLLVFDKGVKLLYRPVE